MSYQTEETVSILDGGVETFTAKKESRNKLFSLVALVVLCVAGASYRAGQSYGAANATASAINLGNNLDLGISCEAIMTWTPYVQSACGGVGSVGCFVDAYVSHMKNFDHCPGENLPICKNNVKPYLVKNCL